MKKTNVINGVICGLTAFALSSILAQASYICGKENERLEARKIFKDFQQDVIAILNKGEEAE